MRTTGGGGRRREVSVPDLVSRTLAGETAAVARLISLVEGGSPLLREAMAALAPHAGRAHVVGLTGAPGVGKSTTTSALVAHWRGEGLRVAVLAVDPSSPFTGGAMLGDRIRMSEHADDPGVFIRSMASRGHLGGLAHATPQAVRVLDAAGFDVVVVETVGVGQSEIEIAQAADTTVVLLAPGMGDGIQAAKAGLLEIGDVYVVNKSDRPGAGVVRRDLRAMLSLSERPDGAWERPVLKAIAQDGDQPGSGIPEVAAAICRHREWAVASGELDRRRVARQRAEIEALALTMLRERWGDLDAEGQLDPLVRRVLAGDQDPHGAAEELLARWR